MSGKKKGSMVPVTLAPVGAVCKRTPANAFCETIREPDRVFLPIKVVSHTSKRGKPHWRIRWGGMGEDGDSWEPKEHLPGFEHLVEEYEAKLADEVALAEQREQAKKAAKEATAREAAISGEVRASARARKASRRRQEAEEQEGARIF
jgi:hypothetical protein